MKAIFPIFNFAETASHKLADQRLAKCGGAAVMVLDISITSVTVAAGLCRRIGGCASIAFTKAHEHFILFHTLILVLFFSQLLGQVGHPFTYLSF